MSYMCTCHVAAQRRGKMGSEISRRRTVTWNLSIIVLKAAMLLGTARRLAGESFSWSIPDRSQKTRLPLLPSSKPWSDLPSTEAKIFAPRS